MNELRRCLFCGCDATLERYIWYHGSKMLPLVTFTVRCVNCDIETQEYSNVYDAIDEWNWEM